LQQFWAGLWGGTTRSAKQRGMFTAAKTRSLFLVALGRWGNPLCPSQSSWALVMSRLHPLPSGRSLYLTELHSSSLEWRQGITAPASQGAHELREFMSMCSWPSVSNPWIRPTRWKIFEKNLHLYWMCNLFFSALFHEQ
jgi:hypothetical protein